MISVRFALVSAILMFAVACGGGASTNPNAPSPTPSPTPTPGGPSTSVAIPAGAESLGNRAYSPDNLDITVGTTVTWMNTDSIPHTSTSDATGWNSGTLDPGGRFSFTFQNAGTFPYHCTIHPGMVGTVVVR
jgi:plastocyanin